MTIIVFVLLLVSQVFAVAATPGKALTFGLFPGLDPANVDRISKSVLDEVSNEIDYPIVFKLSSNYENITGWLKNDELDLALVPIINIDIAKENYNIILQFEGKEAAKLWTLPENNINSFEDLKGKTLALPPIESSLTTQALLELSKKKLIEDVQIVYVSSHISCVQMVFIHAADACVTLESIVNQFQKGIDVKAKSVFEFEPLPRPAIVASKSINIKLQNKLKQSLKENMSNQVYALMGMAEGEEVEYVDKTIEEKLFAYSIEMKNKIKVTGKVKYTNRFGVYPMFSPEIIHDTYQPICEYLDKKLKNTEFELVTAKNYEVFSSRLRAGYYKVALINPRDYWLNARGLGYHIAARRKGFLEPIMLVIEDSYIREPIHLIHRKIGIPGESALVTLIAKKYLETEAGIDRQQLEFVNSKSHRNCLYALSVGEVDACVSNRDALNSIKESLPARLRVFIELPSVPNEAVVLYGTQDEANKLGKLLVGLNGESDGMQVLEKTGLDGFVLSSESEYSMLDQYVTGDSQ
ncbi:MAG: PhnD/SsuA/transferrin family substrate-binding protein [bacterium]